MPPSVAPSKRRTRGANDVFVSPTAATEIPAQLELGESVQLSPGGVSPLKLHTTVGMVPALNCFGKTTEPIASSPLGALTAARPC